MARVASRGLIVDTIGPHLDLLMLGLTARVEGRAHRFAKEIELDAKYNAPWEDRTGEARDGLTASVSHEDGEIIIELFHTVEYGEWLELIQDGRFAIIMPTLEKWAPEVLSGMGGSVLGL